MTRAHVSRYSPAGTLIMLCFIASCSFAAKPTVALFVVDGLQIDAARVAMEGGATNMKYLFDNGVWVQEAYCTSPSERLYLPDGSSPWGTASSPNVAMHTGTHVFESRQMDDIFLAAQRAHIVSVFAGSAENYAVFNTADYSLAVNLQDSLVFSFAVSHLMHDDARLVSIHLQELRRHWGGPESKTRPGSDYQQALLTVDHLLGKLLDSLKATGNWDSTYVIVTSDHGMGMTSQSGHPPSVLSSWKPYMNFFGPGVKRGSSIPYAESPDIAIMIDFVLHLPPLLGHTDQEVAAEPRGTTGTLLTNIFEGNPPEIAHPQFIRRYLENMQWKPSDDYAEYRAAMLGLIKDSLLPH